MRPSAHWASPCPKVDLISSTPFQAAGREAVQRFDAAAIAAGGRDNVGPDERHYHPGYYGAFALDPDGNNIEAVFHGPAVRSTPSIVIKAAVEK